MSISSTAGWLVDVLSFESSVTLAEPSDVIRMPLLLPGALAHSCTSDVTSTIRNWLDAGTATVVKASTAPGTVAYVTVPSVQLLVTSENRRFPAARRLFTKTVIVALRMAGYGGRPNKSNCTRDCVVGLTLRFAFDP
jgi:hypothetical protein